MTNKQAPAACSLHRRPAKAMTDDRVLCLLERLSMGERKAFTPKHMHACWTLSIHRKAQQLSSSSVDWTIHAHNLGFSRSIRHHTTKFEVSGHGVAYIRFL